MKRMVLIIAVICVKPVFAQQSIDLATFSFKKGFDKSVNENSGSITESTVFGNLKVPVSLSEKTIWYNDISYFGYRIDGSELGFGNLSGIIFQTGVIQKVNENTSVLINVVPRLMSDLNELDGSHFQFGTIALLQKKYHEELILRYGLVVNQEYFGTLLAPVLYVDWKMNSKWFVDGLLPMFTKIGYQATEKLQIGGHYYGIITSYRLGENSDYVERRATDLSIFGRYRFTQNLHLEVRAGYSFARKYEQYAEKEKVNLRLYSISFGDDRLPTETKIDPSPMLDFRLVFNLPIE